jgi:hypothetical protein
MEMLQEKTSHCLHGCYDAYRFMDLPTEDCPHCAGTGKRIKQRGIGAKLRKEREKAKRSLRGVAEELGISAPYLLDMEMGRRNWSEARINQYQKAIK